MTAETETQHLQGVNEVVVGDLPKGDDLVTRVRTLEVDGESFVDIRELVTSTGRYGRGVLIPTNQRAALTKLLRSI